MNRRSFIQRLAWLPTLGVASKAEPKIADPVPDVDLTEASLERMLREIRKQIHDNAALAAKPRRVLIL